MNFLSTLILPAKRLAQMVFGRASSFRVLKQPRSHVNFENEVGDGTSSSTVMAPLFWIARTFPEAPVALWETDPTGKETQIRDHPFLRLMRRPNPFYSGPVLWQATIIDYSVDGNSYWIKIRDKGGQVVQYWWAPHWTMKVRGDERNFISHYEYKPGDTVFNIMPEDLIHFRFGLDSENPRMGRAPLKSVLREIFTDDEAANFTASLLRNMGVPGLLISPEKGAPPPSSEDVKETKAYIKEKFTRDSRGEALVMSGATQVEQFGFSPEQLQLKEIRRIPEERISGVLAVPAVVAGLGAGLDRSTFNNFAEARQAAYEPAITPSQTLLSEDLWFQALPDFESEDNIWNWRAGFDTSHVRALQEDRNKLTNRQAAAYRAGIARRSEARSSLGLTVAGDGSDDVYQIPMNTAIVPTDGGEPQIFTQQKGA